MDAALRYKSLAGWAFGIGLVVFIIMLAGWMPPLPDAIGGPILAVTLVLLYGGGAVWGLLEAWAWFRRRRPSGTERDRAAAQASRLGLRSVERDVSALDFSFPFLGGGPPSTGGPMGKLLHPKVDWIFAGNWRQLDVRVFDFSLPKGEDREEWTCVQLPIEIEGPDLEITRERMLDRFKQRLGRKDLTVGDEQFDRAFQVQAEDEDAARRVLSPAMRARLLELAPPFQFLLQLKGERMLCCTMRLRVEDREAVLDLATRLADALPKRD